MASAEQYLNRANARLEALLDEASLQEERLLRMRPEPQAWSPLQILQHLCLIDEQLCAFFRRKRAQQDYDPPPRTLRSRVLASFVDPILRLPLKVKSPKMVDVSQDHPARLPDLQTLAHGLRSSRMALLEEMRRAPDAWSKKLPWRHPFLGGMSVNDTAKFIAAHQARHVRQFKRALAQNARNDRR